jgi:hypothetical protein
MDLVHELDEWLLCFSMSLLATIVFFVSHNNMDVFWRYGSGIIIVLAIYSLSRLPPTGPELPLPYASAIWIIHFALNPMDPERRLAGHCVH